MSDRTFPDEPTAHYADPKLGDSPPHVRSHDAEHVLAEVRTVVTNHPGLALIVAAAGGFLLGRVLSRD